MYRDTKNVEPEMYETTARIVCANVLYFLDAPRTCNIRELITYTF
jgi:hypothetical protein